MTSGIPATPTTPVQQAQPAPTVQNAQPAQEVAGIYDLASRLQANVSRVIVGKQEEIRLMLVAMLCEGHVLIEDVPGIGKTTLAKSLARSLGCTFHRIQFTPALLEAMEERQVTIDLETVPLPRPFMVLATQNPIELEGTFPLPEVQLDRFLVKLSIGYPSAEEEEAILDRFALS